MRRRPAAGTTLAALLTAVLSACGSPALPADVDKSLTDDWAKVADVRIQVPEAGICLPNGRWYPDSRRVRTPDRPVACDQPHMIEVVHVGTLTGDAKPTPTRLAAAYAECDTATAKYLGRPWWEGRLRIDVSLPWDAAWEGGARWFRCDLAVIGDASKSSTETLHVGSLKGAIPAELLLGCANYVAGGTGRSISEVPCAKRHNLEWAGFFRAAAAVPYPGSDRQWQALHDQCRAQVAKFLGVGASQARSVLAWAMPRHPTDWKAGDHAVRCAIWFDGKTMTKSAKGSKGKGVPYF